MMSLILRLLINAIALLALAEIDHHIRIASLGAAIVVALVLGIVNAVLRPILVILSLPLEILTLGLFTFVINAALFLLVANLHIGLEIDGFMAAFVGAIALSLISFVLSLVLGAVEKA